MSGLICWNCGKTTGVEGRPSRNDYCPHCQSDLRCCRGCRFFDPSVRWHCREPIDTFVTEKDKANFCDWFQARQAVHSAGKIIRNLDGKDAKKKAFDDLFKD